MAIDAATLDQDVSPAESDQRDWARSLRKEQLGQLRQGRLRGDGFLANQPGVNNPLQRQARLNALRRARPALANPLEQTAQTAARLAYKRGWQYLEEGVEGLCLAYFGAGVIVAGPLAIGVYLLRLMVGTWMGGGPAITFHGMSVPVIPGFDAPEMIYRTSKIIFIGAITAVVWIAITLVIIAITNPGFFLAQWFCKYMPLLIQPFGVQCVVS